MGFGLKLYSIKKDTYFTKAKFQHSELIWPNSSYLSLSLFGGQKVTKKPRASVFSFRWQLFQLILNEETAEFWAALRT
jgi:hypothetical protein